MMMLRMVMLMMMMKMMIMMKRMEMKVKMIVCEYNKSRHLVLGHRNMASQIF